jgi:hypothetical protein
MEETSSERTKQLEQDPLMVVWWGWPWAASLAAMTVRRVAVEMVGRLAAEKAEKKENMWAALLAVWSVGDLAA